MDTPVIKEHFRKPRNRGRLKGADAIGRAGAPGCGAEILLYLDFDGPAISEAAFEASGSSAIIAAGSVATGKLTGMSWKQAAAMPRQMIEAALAGGSSPSAAARQAAEFTVEALHAALEDSLRRDTFPPTPAVAPGTVMVAMSGGVDSSTACLLEKEAGHDVIGITMRLWSDPACEPDDVGCCSPQAIREAREVCHGLGLPHLTVDYRDRFEESVVDNFVTGYLSGRTPNPCTCCNGSFRFPALVELAGRLGAAKAATGHYARIVEQEGRLMIARGHAAAKDQSYMLWGIEQKLLEYIGFPLGEMEKSETRRQARQAGLPVHERPESQEVCFIPDDDYRRFLKARLATEGITVPGEGDIADRAGGTLGRHTGYLNYTIGQRHGLGVSAREPLYVLSIDAENNSVTVGTREELAVSRLELSAVNAFTAVEDIKAADVQVRYNSPALPAKVGYTDNTEHAGARNATSPRLHIELEEPAYGVAPGQSAVIYAEDAVVAGGVIAAAKHKPGA